MARGGSSLRANYLYGVLHAARLANVLGIPAISVLEFGVAGNDSCPREGEDRCLRPEEAFGVSIDVYGFDSGRGLPKPTDFRDCPNLFLEGQFPLDEARLLPSLEPGDLILGLVTVEQVPEFVDTSVRRRSGSRRSTLTCIRPGDCFRVACIRGETLNLMLPRVLCYFDDITGFTYADHNGERLAIYSDSTLRTPSARSRRGTPPSSTSRSASHTRSGHESSTWRTSSITQPYGDHDGLVRREAAGIGGASSFS